MALKTFVRKTTEVQKKHYIKTRLKLFRVTFYKKNGAVVFSTGLREELAIKKYHSVSIHQDSDDVNAWYLEFGHGDFTICEINKTSLGFGCMHITDELFTLYGIEGNIVKCPVIVEPVIIEEKTLYKIDTSALIK